MEYRHARILTELNDHLKMADPAPQSLTATEYAARVAASLARVRATGARVQVPRPSNPKGH